MINNVIFEGKVVSCPKYSHQTKTNKFYQFMLSCQRKSGVFDEIPVMVTLDLWEKLLILEGDYIRVKGRFQSYNSKEEENYGKRIVYINAFEVDFCEKKDCKNDISMEGIICKQPTYRISPRGKQICDLVLKTYTDDGKAYYYIPCVCWFNNALKASLCDVGTKIQIRGRLQSREYIKICDGNKTYHTTYEVAVSDIKNN